MKAFDVQAIDLNIPRAEALAFISDRCIYSFVLTPPPVTRLESFRGDSRFRTWVYRIACNQLLTLRRQRMEEHSLSFEEFGEDLARGLADDSLRVEGDADRNLLLEEVKIGCTLAMLMCLDRNHRLAYILGEIVELDHREAAEVLEITPAAFRKRLSRARSSITSFMISRCGLANPANACRCRRRVAPAIQLGRVDPANLRFAKFEAAEALYSAFEEVDTGELERWLAKARDIQWDYENLVRRKGRLERLK